MGSRRLLKQSPNGARVNDALKEWPMRRITGGMRILLENTAGMGASRLRFEELAAIRAERKKWTWAFAWIRRTCLKPDTRYTRRTGWSKQSNMRTNVRSGSRVCAARE